MKKIIFLSVSLLMSTCIWAQSERPLPVPNKNVNMTLFQALQKRQSIRSFIEKDVDDATLSTILWAAAGISRPEVGKLTVPSAINAQDIQIYVCKSTGAYLWDAAKNILIPVSSEDLRVELAGRQSTVAKAPIFLLLVSNQAKFGGRPNGETYGYLDAGYVSQNIYLASTAFGLGTVARYGMNREVLKKKLNLTDQQLLVLNHPLGWQTPSGIK